MISVVVFFGTYIIVIICLVYSLLFGNCSFHKRGYLRALRKFFFKSIPLYFFKLFRHIFPKQNQRKAQAQNRKKPLYPYFVITSYYILYLFFAGVFLTNIYPHMQDFLQNAEFHKIMIFIVLPSPWLVIIIMQLVDPGIINEENINYYLEQYPYDGVLYKPTTCAHLKIPAVARSRYCEFTHQRIAKYYHLSSWVLQVIGENTIGLYLLFLLLNIANVGYFGTLTFMFLKGVYTAHAAELDGNVNSPSKFAVVTLVLLENESVSVGFLGALLIIFAALLSTIWKYLYCISTNVTTVELEMYEKENEKRRKEGHPPVKNFYDKGFIENWRELIASIEYE